MSILSDMHAFTNARGSVRYEIEVRHNKLHKHQVIKGDCEGIVKRKAEMKAQEWDEQWSRQETMRLLAQQREHQKAALASEKAAKKESAETQTREAEEALSEMESILSATLSVDDAVDWDSLMDCGDYPQPRPEPPTLGPPPPEIAIEVKPKRDDPEFQPKIGLVDRLSAKRRQLRAREAEERFFAAHQCWESAARKIHGLNQQAKEAYSDKKQSLLKRHMEAMALWERLRSEYLTRRDETNAAILQKKTLYLAADPEAIREYCEIVLSRSSYPDSFPKTFELEYRADAKLLIVEYELPAPGVMPSLREVKYVPSRDQFEEKHLTQKQINGIYDSVVYQIALRTLHELYEADTIDGLNTIVFNGMVTSTDPATGIESTKCIISVQVTKADFMQINLGAVDPKACFRKLKGVGSSELHSITPIAPIAQLEREDRRFVESYAVAHSLNAGTNVAAMNWEDFEHLIREVFEREFSAGGGEVRVTRASRDGGVDAVVFDPDPIRGGKIVIQAKRYTNTVGVSAVRDLYGTLVNEGANKGILVSTADYGPDAYEFAKGKPITLLNGSNLLHLLQKHGHTAFIDLKEAKKELSAG